MKSFGTLIHEVAIARQQLIDSVSGLSHQQCTFKSSEEVWSVVDNVEHLVWAEQGGINGIWKTFEALKRNAPLWTGEAIHHGLSIEQIIERTWKSKEQVPEVAKPRWGGPLSFWIISLKNCQPLLESLGNVLAGADLEKIIYPHAISGPLNVIQRMEFLRFHLNRHQKQIEGIKAHNKFPTN